MKKIVEFRKLPLKNAAIRHFLFEPQEKLLLGLLVISDDKKTVDNCELQFNRLLHANINLSSNNFLGEIQDFFVSQDSYYLSEIIKNIKPISIPINEFSFFSISLESGRLNIIAEDFVFSTIQRIEVIGSCN